MALRLFGRLLRFLRRRPGDSGLFFRQYAIELNDKFDELSGVFFNFYLSTKFLPPLVAFHVGMPPLAGTL
jgi:hypothetical protein